MGGPDERYWKKTRLRRFGLLRDAGGRCCVCGYDDLRALEFHHKRDKSFGLSVRSMQGKSDEAIRNEVSKCVVMCACCHRIETHPWSDHDEGVARSVPAPRSHCPNGHPTSDINRYYYMSNGARRSRCWPCMKLQERARYKTGGLV